MSGLEVYNLSPESARLAQKLIHEYDVHEAREIRKEQAVCFACTFFETCQYSYYNTTRNRKKWVRQPKFTGFKE